MASHMDCPTWPNPDVTMIDTIWQMGTTSLFSNKNQIIIPLYMADTIGEEGVVNLKSRLSQLFGNAPTTAHRDLMNNVMRICLTSDYTPSPVTGIAYASPPESTPSPQSTASAPVIASDMSIPSTRRTKVPRPPNSFILYRQEYHPKLKAQNPDLHNNDISVILGKQWGMEPQSVKDKYKSRAGALKKKHAAENPGYQYAPRKPSEKKRRMTARKIVQLQASTEEHLHSLPTDNIIHLTDDEQIMPRGVLLSEKIHDESMTAAQPDLGRTAEDRLGIRRPESQGNISGPGNNGEMSVIMPTNPHHFNGFQQQFTEHLVPAESYSLLPFDSFNRETMTADGAQHNTNDQDFLNSLIDWEGIQADADMIHQMTADDRTELAAAGAYGTNLLFADDAASKFRAELERVSKML